MPDFKEKKQSLEREYEVYKLFNNQDLNRSITSGNIILQQPASLQSSTDNQIGTGGEKENGILSPGENRIHLAFPYLNPIMMMSDVNSHS